MSKVRPLLSVFAALAVTGCDISAECLPWFKGISCFTSDLGLPCSDDPVNMDKVMVRPSSSDVVSDPSFENCSAFYCTSTNGSRPYCTRRCETNIDCDPGGLPCIPGQPCERDKWRCEVVIQFGALACKQLDENGTCELDPDTGAVKDPVKYCRAADGHIPPPEGFDGGTTQMGM